MERVTITTWTTPARAVSAEGARIGFVTCLCCGATITRDPGDDDFDPVVRHIEWHIEHGEKPPS